MIVKDLINYFTQEAIDFRRAIPLLQGLHVLFSRKISYLLKDSEAILQQMKNPIAELIKIEESPAKEKDGEKSKARKQSDGRFKQAAEAGFKINPQHFDWFIAGIDQDRLKKILLMDIERDGLKDDELEAKIKLENTFAIVREEDGELQGINNPLSDFNGLNLAEFE